MVKDAFQDPALKRKIVQELLTELRKDQAAKEISQLTETVKLHRTYDGHVGCGGPGPCSPARSYGCGYRASGCGSGGC